VVAVAAAEIVSVFPLIAVMAVFAGIPVPDILSPTWIPVVEATFTMLVDPFVISPVVLTDADKVDVLYCNVPEIERLLQVNPVASNVTVCPLAMTTLSLAPGTIPPTHVAPVLQFPVPAEVVCALATDAIATTSAAIKNTLIVFIQPTS
jgi:hypothetical protein